MFEFDPPTEKDFAARIERAGTAPLKPYFATIDAARARTYLESYFHSARVSLYWGSTEHFVRELNDTWGARR